MLQHLLNRQLHAVKKTTLVESSLFNCSIITSQRFIPSVRNVARRSSSESTTSITTPLTQTVKATSPKSSPPVSTTEGTLGSIFFTSLCAITFGLGVWQTRRYFEKVEMMKKREEDLELPCLTFAEWLKNKNISLDASYPGKLDVKLPSGDTNLRGVKSERSYRLVSIRGTFSHEKQMLIGPRGPPPGALAETGPNSGRGGGGGMSSSTQGYWVLTPLIVAEDDDSTNIDSIDAKSRWFGGKAKTKPNSDSSNIKEERMVWINRGWIPRHFVDKDAKIISDWDQPQKTVQIMTMESDTDQPRTFSPPSRLETTNNSGGIPKLLWLDRQAISELTNCSLGQTPPLFVQINDGDVDEASQFPARSSRKYVGEFKVTPEVHAGYAVTWFGLSGAGILMTRKLLTRGR